MAVLTTKTDKSLLNRLAESAKRGLTASEIQQQRISFIYAGMPVDSDMSKVDIEKSLAKA